jgi:hypothetical protein
MKTYVSEFWIGAGTDRVLANTHRGQAVSIKVIRDGLATGELNLTTADGQPVPKEIKDTFCVLVISREVPANLQDVKEQLKLL